MPPIALKVKKNLVIMYRNGYFETILKLVIHSQNLGGYSQKFDTILILCRRKKMENINFFLSELKEYLNADISACIQVLGGDEDDMLRLQAFAAVLFPQQYDSRPPQSYQHQTE